MRLPKIDEAKPHCGLSASRSRGTYRAASRIRSVSSSRVSNREVFVDTRPNTTTLSSEPLQTLLYRLHCHPNLLRKRLRQLVSTGLPHGNRLSLNSHTLYKAAPRVPFPHASISDNLL